MRVFMQKVLMPRLREPFLRFLLLGLLLLIADHVFNPGQFNAGHTDSRIIVTTTHKAALVEAFRSEHGRAPRADELQARLEHWIDEQVLYREALALGLDRRDAIVQRQLTQKMRFLLEDAVVLPAPSRDELQAWLDQHPERYGKLQTISFEQVFLSRGRHGDDIQHEAARMAGLLAKAPEDFVGMGDAFLVGQVVDGADEVHLRKDFGVDFARALDKLPEGAWAGPVISAFGLHLVRINSRGSFQPAQLDEVIGRVRVDYRLAQREQHNREALDQLRAHYRIEFERGDETGKAG